MIVLVLLITNLNLRYAAVKVPCKAYAFRRPWVTNTEQQIKIKCLGKYLPRKEVIQQHLPVQLPCYDFTPLTLHTFGASVHKVRPATSGADDSGGVTGGVYKTRERIHRDVLIRDY